MSDPRRDAIDEWGAVSARAARATSMRRPLPSARPRPARAAAGLGALTIGVVVVVAALALRPSVGPAASGAVTATTDDGTFRLTLSTPQGTYGPTDPIAPVATLTYLGPDPQVSIFHASHAIGFRIEGVGDDRAMGGGTRLPCRSTDLTKDQPITQAFWKGGSPDEVFDRAWYEDPVLRLPAGTWRIVAMLNVMVGAGCRGAEQRLEVTNVIRVVDGAPSPIETGAPSPSAATESPTPSAVQSPSTSTEPTAPMPSDGPVTGRTDDGIFRLELTTPSGIYGPTDAITPVARLTYVGPDPAVTFGHSDPAVFFTIEEVDGRGRQMTGGANDVCLSTTIRRDVPSTIPFHKSGQTDLGFDLAWFQDPVLRLPAGTWRIRVRLEAYVPECGADSDVHQPIAKNVITVR
jgi:hypothetical protein